MTIAKNIVKCLRPVLHRAGVDLVRHQPAGPDFPVDMDALTQRIYLSVRDYTDTGVARIHALINAVKYLVKANIPGDFVECGVYRGGSAMVMALSLNEFGDSTRQIRMYDTYSGMTAPTDVDVAWDGQAAAGKFEENRHGDGTTASWCYAPLDEVKRNLAKTNYPTDKLDYIVGPVEDTLPKEPKRDIALLRLDTDWYESTKCELDWLFPRLVPGGVLLLDDYGKWQGSRKAVDDYIEKHSVNILLNRVDTSCRIAVKSA